MNTYLVIILINIGFPLFLQSSLWMFHCSKQFWRAKILHIREKPRFITGYYFFHKVRLIFNSIQSVSTYIFRTFLFDCENFGHHFHFYMLKLLCKICFMDSFSSPTVSEIERIVNRWWVRIKLPTFSIFSFIFTWKEVFSAILEIVKPLKNLRAW